MLLFFLLIVFSRIKAQEGGFELLRKEAIFTTFNHLRKLRTILSLSLSFLGSSNKDTIWLHYLCSSHPFFRVLRFMFPHLFQGSDILELHCDLCKLAKHTRVSFPISNKRRFHPFHLIYSDIWVLLLYLMFLGLVGLYP